MKDTFKNLLIGGRKFTISMFSLVIFTILIWFDKIDQSVYSMIVLGVIGAYITSNIAQDYILGKE